MAPNDNIKRGNNIMEPLRRSLLQIQAGGSNLGSTELALPAEEEKESIASFDVDVDIDVTDLRASFPPGPSKDLGINPWSKERTYHNRRGGIFIRNKVQYNRSVEKLQDMQRSLERASSHNEIPNAKEVIDVLACLQETNEQNEATIQHLQQELVRASAEQEEALEESSRLGEELHQERFGFAAASRKHNKEKKEEIHALKRNMKKLARRCKQLEAELEEKDILLKFQGTQEEDAETRHGQLDGEDTKIWKRKAKGLELVLDITLRELEEKSLQSSITSITAATSSADSSEKEQIGSGFNRKNSNGSHTSSLSTLSRSMDGKLVDFAKVHEDVVDDYEKLLDQSETSISELSRSLDASKIEVGVLRQALEDTKRERDEAYETCEILQQEIDMLSSSSSSSDCSEEEDNAKLTEFKDEDPSQTQCPINDQSPGTARQDVSCSADIGEDCSQMALHHSTTDDAMDGKPWKRGTRVRFADQITQGLFNVQHI